LRRIAALLRGGDRLQGSHLPSIHGAGGIEFGPVNLPETLLSR
jgi:hypothetical protein